MSDKYKSDFVNVVARVKPNIEDERAPECLHINADPPAIVIHERQQNYFFDHVFDQDADQETLYEKSVKHLVDKIMLGYNCTVFAYGRTGSGKTYTMGTDGSSQSSDNNRGIIIRTIYDIMNRLNDNIEINMNVSFYEIYNEKVYDLLSDADKRMPLKVKGFQICDLTKFPINDFYEGYTLLEQGGKKRHKGETKQNATSSRSHAIFTIYVNVKNENAEFHVKLNLVDLAGSECVKRTGTEGSQFQEGVYINLGLLSIGQVISALSKTTSNNHIPYRESIITTVLKDSLNRNNYITLIVCISANILDLFDTIQTLDFAQRARKLKSNPEKKIISNQNKSSKTPTRYLFSSVKKHPASNSVLPQHTPLKRPIPFTTSTSFNTNNKQRLLQKFSTPVIHPAQSVNESSSDHFFVPSGNVKTTFSSTNALNNEIVPLCSTEMEMQVDNSFVSVASSRLDSTALSPRIRGYLERIHNEAVTKLDNTIQEKLDALSNINLTISEIIKIKQILQATLETNNDNSPKNGFVAQSQESLLPDPDQNSTFVENFTTSNNRRSARTNLQTRFDSPDKSNDDTIFKRPKPMPRKRCISSTVSLNKPCPGVQEPRTQKNKIQTPPAERRRSVRILEKSLQTYDNSILHQHVELTSRNSSNFNETKSPVLNRRKSVRLSIKMTKKTLVQNNIISTPKKAPEPALRQRVVTTAQNNYNRILNILNYGTEKKLMELSVVGMKTAKQIYLYRSINGIFKKIYDLSEMPLKGNTYQRFLEANFVDCENV